MSAAARYASSRAPLDGQVPLLNIVDDVTMWLSPFRPSNGACLLEEGDWTCLDLNHPETA